MRILFGLMTSAALLAGCATNKSAQSQPASVDKPKKIVVAQTPLLVGTVVSVRTNLGFAVLNFPVGTTPENGRHLTVYRHGLKVGELKVTGPRQDDITVGDITTGEVQPGDEIRGE